MEEDSGAVDEEAFCKRYFICRTRDCKQEYDLDHSSSDLQILPIQKKKEKEREEFLFFLRCLYR